MLHNNETKKVNKCKHTPTNPPATTASSYLPHTGWYCSVNNFPTIKKLCSAKWLKRLQTLNTINVVVNNCNWHETAPGHTLVHTYIYVYNNTHTFNIWRSRCFKKVQHFRFQWSHIVAVMWPKWKQNEKKPNVKKTHRFKITATRHHRTKKKRCIAKKLFCAHTLCQVSIVASCNCISMCRATTAIHQQKRNKITYKNNKQKKNETIQPVAPVSLSSTNCSL